MQAHKSFVTHATEIIVTITEHAQTSGNLVEIWDVSLKLVGVDKANKLLIKVRRQAGFASERGVGGRCGAARTAAGGGEGRANNCGASRAPPSENLFFRNHDYYYC